MDWLTFKITLAIHLSLQVYQEPSYMLWAHKWLDGSDRTYAASDAAYAAAYAADAADAAAYAAYAAAYADAYAADVSCRRSIRLGAKIEAVCRFI